MSKKNISILSTGSLSPDTMDRVLPPGITLDSIPFTRINYSNDPEIVARIEHLASRQAVVVFTSANAVRAVIARLNYIPEWKIYCTAGPTRQLIESFFGEQSIVFSGNNAAEIVAQIILRNERSLLFFCGEQRLNILPNALRERQILLEECIVYNSIPEHKALDKKYNAYLFFSPLAVKTFFTENQIAPDAILFALGKTTAQAISQYSNLEIRLATRPDKAGLLDQAIDFFTIYSIQASR